MFSPESLIKKWQPIIEHEECSPVQDSFRRNVLAQLLENQEQYMIKERQDGPGLLTESSTTTANVQNWDPVLISLVRRAMPNLIAYDIVGVQPMTGPTGLVFAMRSRYTSRTGDEALFNEADTAFSGIGNHVGGSFPGTGEVWRLKVATAANSGTSVTLKAGDVDSLPGAQTGNHSITIGAYTYVGTLASAGAFTITDPSAGLIAAITVDEEVYLRANPFGVGTAAPTTSVEQWGTGSDSIPEMSFSIEKATVTAASRALRASYTQEISQDLKAIHGLDAESELANICSAEILAEINREVVRTVNSKAKLGASQTGITNHGTFDLAADSDGRWNKERYEGLIVQIQRDANAIAKGTRRGKGNWLLCSSDVATAVFASGQMTQTKDTDLSKIDDTGNSFVGSINGQLRVFIDPYAPVDYCTVGFRGNSPYDAGMFYCPYVPLTMVRAVGENDFQPRIGFKTRYGMIANPFAEATEVNGVGSNRSNEYFRIFGVSNLL